LLRLPQIGLAAKVGAPGDSNIPAGTALVHRALTTLRGNICGPALPLLAWREMQSDCIPRQAHRSLIPHKGHSKPSQGAH